MKYKINDNVLCDVEIRPNGKYVVNKELLENAQLEEDKPRTFKIIAKDKVSELYTILIDDDLVGWYINDFHIKHQEISPKFKGLKFFDIHEYYILGKE